MSWRMTGALLVFTLSAEVLAQNLYQPAQPPSDAERFGVRPPVAAERMVPIAPPGPAHEPVQRMEDGRKIYRTSPLPRVYVHPDQQCCGSHGWSPLITIDPYRDRRHPEAPAPEPLL